MTYLEHLNSLRKHLWFSVVLYLIGFIIGLIFYEEVTALLKAPLDEAAKNTGNELYLTTIYEGFTARIKVSLIAAFAITLPFHISNIVVFVFPALTGREKRLTFFVLFSGFVLILLSLYYGYRFLIPFSIEFLTGESFRTEGTAYLLGFTKNILYIVQFFTALVVIFQLPLLMILLISLKVITIKGAFVNGRYVIVFSFVISALLTPPDMVSQVMTALPLIILYYLALLIARIFRLGD